MRFTLVIPALNEEEAIAATLRRALAAREKVCTLTGVSEMTIVFVNDGSTDRTQQIVEQPEFDEVIKIRFERNRGYGAAIKAGWQAADAELVGFIDADGTCEPDFCVDLLRRLESSEADVVLAARLNPDSRMPLIRKIGNVLFARLLGLVSGNDLTDTASGFRIVRRSSLRLLSPLPDGLHFTPAMSCICLLDPRLHIEEVPMPYEERIGRSKLSVVKDGLRFLYTILFSGCCYAPIKTLFGASALVALLGGLGSWAVSAWGGTSGPLVLTALALIGLMMCTGLICHQLNFLLIGPRQRVGRFERLLQAVLHYKRLVVGGTAATCVGILVLALLALVGPSAARSGVTIGMGIGTVLAVGGGLAVFGGMILRVIWAVGEKQKALIRDAYPLKSTEELGRPPCEPTLPEALVDATEGGSATRATAQGQAVR